MFYFAGSGSIFIKSNSGNGTPDPYYVDGSNSPNGVPSRALQCPGGGANPAGLPATINGNVLLGPCRVFTRTRAVSIVVLFSSRTALRLLPLNGWVVELHWFQALSISTNATLMAQVRNPVTRHLQGSEAPTTWEETQARLLIPSAASSRTGS